MKKYFIFIFFVLSFFIFPKNTYASSPVSFDGTTNYYYQKCRSDIGCPLTYSTVTSKSSTTDWTCPNGFTYENPVTIVSSIKYQQIGVPIEVKQGNMYRIVINYETYYYIYQSWNSWNINLSDKCSSNISSMCNISWELVDGGNPPNGNKIYRATIDLLANTNSSGWVLTIGSNNTRDNIFFNNLNSSQCIRSSSRTIEETSTTVDISPIVDAQNETNDKINETNNKLDSIGDNLVDDTAPSPNDISSFKNSLPALSFGPISGALQIPIQYLNYWNTQFEIHSCTPINFGSLLGTNLTLPCISPVDDYLSSDTTMGGLNSFIGIVCAIFIYYNTALLIVHAWDTWTSFADDFTGLYRPPSGDSYTPKHAKGGGN